jgi:hypothetical protein
MRGFFSRDNGRVVERESHLALRKHFFFRANNIPAFSRNSDGSITIRRLRGGDGETCYAASFCTSRQSKGGKP